MVSEPPTTADLIGLARLLNEAFNRRDWDAVESFYAPDAVSVGVEGLDQLSSKRSREGTVDGDDGDGPQQESR